MKILTRFVLTALITLLVVFHTGYLVKGYPDNLPGNRDGNRVTTEPIALKSMASSGSSGVDRDLVIPYRRRYMRALSGHYRSLEEILENEAPFSEQTLTHIEALLSLAEFMADVFPAGTAMTPEEGWGAKPLIWEELEDFSKLIANFKASLEDLKMAVMDSDTSVNLTDSLTTVREGCLDCHRLYRVRQP